MSHSATTFSFLITSPLINEYLVVIMLGFFGWKITTVYILSGMFLGIVCGIILGQMKLEVHLVDDMLPTDESVQPPTLYASFWARVAFGLAEAVSIIKKLWLWALIGVGIGAFIHNYGSSRDSRRHSDVRKLCGDRPDRGRSLSKRRSARHRARVHDGRFGPEPA